MKQALLSVCIPSYNRPETLLRLLKSIDSADSDRVEIVICEDNSPRRSEIRETVKKFQEVSRYTVVYSENLANLGFDENLQELLRKASGEWIVYMGDDDTFVKGALDKLIEFLLIHSDLGYVLRSYNLVYKDGQIEKFRYYGGNRFFKAGPDSYLELFRKSVFVAGFTIKRKLALPFITNAFDGTLLIQLYLMAEVTLNYPSAYFDEILTEQYERELRPFFGSSKFEKEFYTPGPVTVKNSVNFLKGFSKIAIAIDKKYHLDSNKEIIKDLSKYSYPILSIQRHRGLGIFWNYAGELRKMGFGATLYFYFYVIFLSVFGQRVCDEGVRIIKNILGRTPRL